MEAKAFSSEAEWLAWRRGLITASEMPIIMGVSPYLTPFELWEQKLGLKTHEQSNMAINKGKFWEPKVRAVYEFDTGMEFPPLNVEAYPFGASLDGLTKRRTQSLRSSAWQRSV